MVGYNYRMPNLNAALLVAQLEKLDDFIYKKEKTAKEYENFLNQKNINFLKSQKSVGLITG